MSSDTLEKFNLTISSDSRAVKDASEETTIVIPKFENMANETISADKHHVSETNYTPLYNKVNEIDDIISNQIEKALFEYKGSITHVDCAEENGSSTFVEEQMHTETDTTDYIDFNDEEVLGLEEVLDKIYGEYKITLSDTYEKPEPILEYKGRPIIRSGNITTIKGPAKSTKSFLTSILTTAINAGEYMGIKAGDGQKILLMDTEQCKCDTQEMLLRTKKMVENEGKTFMENRIYVTNIRRMDMNERIAKLEEAIRTGLINLAIIDGIKDFLLDINNIEQCNTLVNFLIRMCDMYNCAFVVIIHENKKDNNARGHLGTELTNKSDVVIQLEKEGNLIKASAAISRKAPFESFYYTIKDEEEDSIAIPVICYPTEKMIEKFTKSQTSQSEEKEQKIIEMVNKMEFDKEYTKAEITKLCNGSPTTYDRYIDKAIQNRLLIMTVNKRIKRVKQ